MKFIKNFSVDIKYGTLKNKALFVCPVVIAISTFIDFINRVHRLESMMIIKEDSAAYGDYWFYLYGGMKEYIPSLGDPFVFPIVWIVVFSTIPFIILNYPFKDMQGIGQQVLVRTGGRSSWWLSKCLWNIFCTVFYHGVIGFAAIGLCLLFKIQIASHINMDLLSMVFEFDIATGINTRTAIPFYVFVLPIFVSLGTNLVQMTLSLFIKPIFSFLAILILMVASAYLLTPYLIGNYAMALRYGWIFESGISCRNGFIVSIVLAIVSITIGLIRFRFYDILNRD